MRLKEKIFDHILENKKLDKKQLLGVFERAGNYKELRQLLIENKLIEEDELLLIFSRALKFPFVDLKRYKISHKNQELLPQEVAFKYTVLPICRIGNILTLATSNPLDVIVSDDIKIITGVENVDWVISRQEDINNALVALYKTSEDVLQAFEEDDSFDVEEVGEVREDLENLINESKLPPIVRAIDLIIYNALKKRASDIHIEPYEDKLLVKYRIDGILSEEFSFPKVNQQAVIARLKIISSLDITESRLPQDGRFKVKFENREIDFRVSSLPINFGEKFVLRVLDKENLSLGLEKLGFSAGPLKLFEEAIKAPFGIILVTGPTGSGKSTTLYSIINQMNNSDKNIVTIEEPVEYNLEGITQIPVNSEIGLTFSVGLRSVLRQSPDIIMVGEIRDSETADIAIKASLTGELILSTLHTNSAVGAIMRLKDMGIEPFLLASSLVSSTAQRLARRLCPKCKEKYTIDEETIDSLGLNNVLKSKVREFYRPKGCSYCGHSGYRGRIAILEIILLDDKIREMIIEERSEADIVQYAKETRGFQSLRENSILQCIDGITSLEEAIRVTSE
ncbi:MAG: type II/IV secretion system protein [Candidatus Omnitrophica bacterium]|jgi:type IV pilus assembly protein PilB|nr:type II/IV secretion system protein [Candidatus Omnitrophota bacterium]